MPRSFRWLVLALAFVSLLPSTLAEEIRIGGRVLGPGGYPFPEASVRLERAQDPVTGLASVLSGEMPAAEATAKTGEDGYYELAAPGAGLWRIRVDAAGFVPQVFPLVPLIEPRELPDLELSGDAGLTVRVTGVDGAPIPGALVALSHEATPSWAFSAGTWKPAERFAVSGPDGGVVLPRSAEDRASLVISADGHATKRQRTIRGNTAEVKLRPAPTRAIQVVSAEGNPEAGVLVTNAHEDHPLGFTGADGRFLVPATTGTVSLRLDAPDGRRLATRLVSGQREKDGPETLSLPALWIVAGRLIDARSRKPVAGGLAWVQEEPWSAVAADRAGGFAVRGPLGRMVRVVAGAPGYQGTEPREVHLADDGRPGPILAMEPAAAIEGTVVDENGQAVAGARVTLEEKRPRTGMMRIEIRMGGSGLPETQTDSRGRFRLGPLDPEKNFTVTAAADGFASGSETVIGLEPRRTRTGVRIALEPGRAVTGRVVDLEGHPIEDALVSLSASQQPGGSGHHRVIMAGGGDDEEPKGRTDADGLFRIAGLKAGTFDVKIRRRGFAGAEKGGVEVPPGDEPADLGTFTLEPGEQILGIVTDPEGQPIEGVRVSVAEPDGGGMMFVMMGSSPGAPEDEPDAVSGPDGWFVVSDLEKGSRVDLTVNRTGFVETTESGVEVPRPEPVAITMQPSSNVSGHVLDPEGNGVAGAQINLTRSRTGGGGGSVFRMITTQQATADDQGFFLYEGIEPGTISLEAEAPGWQTSRIDSIEVPQGENVEGIELPVEPGAILVGRVLAPDGAPAIGAAVKEVGGDGGDPVARFGGGATSDGEGYYRLEGLVPGNLSVEATHESYVRTVRDVEAGPGITNLDFQFEGGQPVRGRVVGPSGEPISGAWVGLAPSGRRWGGPETTATADGSFAIEGVADGDYTVQAAAEGYAPYRGETSVQVAGQPVDGVEVELAAASAITGQVTGVDPARFGEVRVEAFSGEGGFGDSRVDGQGTYRVEDLGPGSFTVRARLGDSGRQARGEVEIAAGAEETRLDLEFGQGLTLSGQVLLGDEPFGNVAVFAVGTDVNHSGEGRTGADGEFRLEGLEPGTYRIETRHWKTGIAYDETVEVQGSRDVTLRIPTAQVSGTVVDAVDRDPLPGVRVELASPEGTGSGSILFGRTAVSDLNGRFQIGNVPDGTWLLGSTKKGYASGSTEVTVQSGRDRDDVRIALDPTEGLTLQVSLPSGGIPESVRIAVLDAAGRPVSSGNFATGENGSVRLSTVPPGSWELLVDADGAAVAAVDATAPGGPLAVPLPPVCTLRVEVPDLAGSNVAATATLTETSSGRRFRTLGWLGGVDGEWRVAAGGASLDGVPPGSWNVRVEASDGRTWEAQASTSPAAPARVVLE